MMGRTHPPTRPAVWAALLLALLLTSWAWPALALDEAEVERRSQALSDQLRCPTCQALSVRDSEAVFSRQIREKVEEMVRQGRTDEEILAYFESRYGEFILRSPKKQGLGLVVWVLPVGALLAGAIWLLARIKTAQEKAQAKTGATPPQPALSPAEQAQVERDLKRFEEGL